MNKCLNIFKGLPVHLMYRWPLKGQMLYIPKTCEPFHSLVKALPRLSGLMDGIYIII